MIKEKAFQRRIKNIFIFLIIIFFINFVFSQNLIDEWDDLGDEEKSNKLKALSQEQRTSFLTELIKKNNQRNEFELSLPDNIQNIEYSQEVIKLQIDNQNFEIPLTNIPSEIKSISLSKIKNSDKKAVFYKTEKENSAALTSGILQKSEKNNEWILKENDKELGRINLANDAINSVFFYGKPETIITEYGRVHNFEKGFYIWSHKSESISFTTTDGTRLIPSERDIPAYQDSRQGGFLVQKKEDVFLARGLITKDGLTSDIALQNNVVLSFSDFNEQGYSIINLQKKENDYIITTNAEISNSIFKNSQGNLIFKENNQEYTFGQNKELMFYFNEQQNIQEILGERKNFEATGERQGSITPHLGYGIRTFGGDFQSNVEDASVMVIKHDGYRGSGTIVSDGSDYYVLTAGHVTPSRGNQVRILLNDGREFRGTVIARENIAITGSFIHDLALIKIERQNNQIFLPSTPISRYNPQIGDFAIRIGYPGGLSTQKRENLRITNYINHEILVGNIQGSPGISGGGYFNQNGQLISVHSGSSYRMGLAYGNSHETIHNFLLRNGYGHLIQIIYFLIKS